MQSNRFHDIVCYQNARLVARAAGYWLPPFLFLVPDILSVITHSKSPNEPSIHEDNFVSAFVDSTPCNRSLSPIRHRNFYARVVLLRIAQETFCRRMASNESTLFTMNATARRAAFFKGNNSWFLWGFIFHCRQGTSSPLSPAFCSDSSTYCLRFSIFDFIS